MICQRKHYIIVELKRYYYKYNNPSDSNSLINSYYYGMEKN